MTDPDSIPIEERPKIRASRAPGRLVAVILLVIIALSVLAWPIGRYLLPGPLKPRKGLFRYPGMTWLTTEEVPGEKGRLNVVVSVDWHEPRVSAKVMTDFTRKLVEATPGKYHYFSVRAYGPDQRLLAETVSDDTARLINVKPGQVPLEGPVHVEGVLWQAVGTVHVNRDPLPEMSAEVRFDDVAVVSVAQCRELMSRLINATRGQYSAYRVKVFNARNTHVLDTWTDGRTLKYRAQPTPAYFNQKPE